jgi:hypothetical protein
MLGHSPSQLQCKARHSAGRAAFSGRGSLRPHRALALDKQAPAAQVGGAGTL